MGVFLAQSHRKHTHAVILRPLPVLIYLPLIYLERVYHLIMHLLLQPHLPFLPGILSLLLLWLIYPRLIGLGDAAWTRLTLHFLKQHPPAVQSE